MKIKTDSGFEIEFEKEKMDNMELLDCLSELESNPIYLSKALNLTMSKEDKERLYNHCRNEIGTVPISLVAKEIIEIFSKAGQEGKN